VGRPGWPLENPVGALEAAALAVTPPEAIPKAMGNRKFPTIKLPAFNGKLSLKSFLAKLKNCSDYYNWTDRQKVCHLKAALEGPAAQILWQIEKNATEKQIIDLLRNRFGDLTRGNSFLRVTRGRLRWTS